MNWETETFGEWFFKFGYRVAGPALTLGIPSCFAWLASLDMVNAMFKISFAQFVLLIVGLIFFNLIKAPKFSTPPDVVPRDLTPEAQSYKYLGLNPDQWKDSKRRALDSLSQFRTAWTWTLAAWATLYLLISIEPLCEKWLTSVGWIDPEKPYLGSHAWAFFTTAKDIANALSTAGLLACYLVSAVTTTDTGNRPFGWLVLLAFIVVAEIILVTVFSIADRPDPRASFLYLSGATIGVLAGAVIGLLTGRLDSRFLVAPAWLLALLFFYAAIQPLYPVLQGILSTVGGEDIVPGNLKEIGPVVLISLAGVLKLLMYLFLWYSVRTGRMLHFLINARLIWDSEASRWSVFVKGLRH